MVNFCVPRQRGSVRRPDSSNCLLIRLRSGSWLRCGRKPVSKHRFDIEAPILWIPNPRDLCDLLCKKFSGHRTKRDPHRRAQRSRRPDGRGKGSLHRSTGGLRSIAAQSTLEIKPRSTYLPLLQSLGDFLCISWGSASLAASLHPRLSSGRALGAKEHVIGKSDHKNHSVMFTNHDCPLSDSVRRSPEFPFPGQHSFDAQVEVQFLPRETDSQVFKSSPLSWSCRFQRRIPRKGSDNNTAI